MPHPKSRKPKQAERSRERLAKSFEILVELLEHYEKDHPAWRVENLIWFIEQSLRILQDGVEARGSRQISWKSPFVTWDFPVAWDWAAWKKKNRVCAGFLYEPLTEENTKNIKMLSRTLSKIMVQHNHVQTLQYYTNGVGFEKKGQTYTPILSPETGLALERVRGIRAKRKVVATLCRPFSIGAANVGFDGADLKDGKFSRKQALELEEATNHIDLEGIDIGIQKDGHSFTVKLVFQIHPPIIDSRERKAYFPLLIGLVFMPQFSTDGTELIESKLSDPETWSRSDRKQFWDFLVGEISRTREELGRERPAEKRERVVTISAKVKVALDSQSSSIDPALQRMLKPFNENGEVIELSYQVESETMTLPIESRLRLVDQLKAIETATSSDAKGLILEELVMALLATIPGFKVQQRVRTETEEIDLVVLNESADPIWIKESPIIVVECKNWSGTCGKNEFVQFKEKLLNRKGRCSLGFLISWNGFSETVTKELMRGSRESGMIALLQGEALRRAVHEGTFNTILRAAWNEAIMT